MACSFTVVSLSISSREVSKDIAKDFSGFSPIFATILDKVTILNFLIPKSVQTDFLSFKYLRSPTLGCKNIGFSELEYVAKSHFPCKCEMVDVGKNHIFKALFVYSTTNISDLNSAYKYSVIDMKKDLLEHMNLFRAEN